MADVSSKAWSPCLDQPFTYLLFAVSSSEAFEGPLRLAEQPFARSLRDAAAAVLVFFAAAARAWLVAADFRH